MPAADGRLEQLESRLAELEAQNRLLEKQRAETEKQLAEEKRGMERATFYADSFAFGLIGTRVDVVVSSHVSAFESSSENLAASILKDGQKMFVPDSEITCKDLEKTCIQYGSSSNSKQGMKKGETYLS